jgi:hypothetical protein
MARPLVLQVAVALPAAARPRVAEAAVAAAADEVVRQRNLPAPCRKLRMAIPTLAAFGIFLTLRERESKGSMLQPAEAVAVAAVAELRAAAELPVRQPPMAALRLRQSAPLAADLPAAGGPVVVAVEAAAPQGG